jgi:hypothetical protein
MKQSPSSPDIAVIALDRKTTETVSWLISFLAKSLRMPYPDDGDVGDDARCRRLLRKERSTYQLFSVLSAKV